MKLNYIKRLIFIKNNLSPQVDSKLCNFLVILALLSLINILIKILRSRQNQQEMKLEELLQRIRILQQILCLMLLVKVLSI